MIQKEMAAKLHASEIRADIDYPKMSSKIWSHVKSEQERAFLAGIDFSNRWYSFKDHRPPYYKTCLVKVHEKTEPVAAWLSSTGDSDIWTICSTDIILPPVKLWRPIF